MVLDFAQGNGSPYSLTCWNRSSGSWYFYLYQRLPGQQADDIFSLAWMTSPYKVGVNSFITFVWALDPSFWWLNTGKIREGTTAGGGGSADASLPGGNSTTFDIISNAPGFSTPVSGTPDDQYLIQGGSNIPNTTFSTGTGTSDFPALIKQAAANTAQQFGADATFWLAATTNLIQAMQVISQGTISNTAQISFPLNTNSLTATLDNSNLWNIS